MKKTFLVIGLVIIIAILAFVFSTNRKKGTTDKGATAIPSTSVSASPESSLTFAQISNTSVPAPWGDDEMITLKKGTYDEKDGSVDMLSETTSFVSTDLNNDGKNDMLAVIVGNSGGTGYFYDLIAFINENGKAKYAATLELGDRIKVNKISADKNVVTVDIITQGPGEGLCCGTLKQVTTYTFDGKAFVEKK
jgi:hypothetical protein